MVSARKVGPTDRTVEDHVADMGETLLPVEVDDVPGRMAGTMEDVEYMTVERNLLALIEEAVRYEITDLHRGAEHLGLALEALQERKIVPVRTDDRHAQCLTQFVGAAGVVDMAMGEPDLPDPESIA